MKRSPVKKQIRSALPIQKVAGNLVFAKGNIWACFHVRGSSYRAESEQRRATLAVKLEEFARVVEADFQILRVSRRFDVEGYIERLRRTSSRRALWDRYLTDQRVLLQKLEPWTPETFVCVSLEAPSLDIQGRATRLFERTPQEMWRDFSAPKTRVNLRSLDVASRAQAAEGCVTSILPARLATFEEIQWLIRRSFLRGLVEAETVPPEASPDGEEEERAIRRWFGESGIEHHARHLHAVSEQGESYQAGLCLGEMDHATPFTRQVELMFTALEEYPWPIDAALNVRFITNDHAVRQVQTQFKKTSAQLQDEEDTVHGAMDEGYERKALARELHARLKGTGEPVLMGTLSFLVAAETEAEMHRRIRIIRRGFPWPLYRPYGDQLDLWKQHLPGQPSLVRGFERPFTPEQIGAMVPHATHEAGSATPMATCFGHTIHGRQPVFIDVAEGPQTNMPGLIAGIGTLGGGKTATGQGSILWPAFLRGARIVDVDPKGDHRFHQLPEVAPYARVIVLGPQPEHAGKLDPLRIAPINERHDAAATFLVDVLPAVDGEIEAAINSGITRVIRQHQERACCWEVVETLRNSEDPLEQKAGRMLVPYAEGESASRLGFARLEDPLPTAAEEQVTYLQVRALKRASVETVRSEMGQNQRHSRAILQLVALYAMKILGDEPNRLKVLMFDEASFLTQDAVGRQLLDTLSRWSRSDYAVPILLTQLLGDITEQDNLIGHWFLFAMRSRGHARKALTALGLDANGPLVDALVEHYGGGRCIYRDLHGRTEEIQVDIDEYLLECLSTTPVERGTEFEVPEPSVASLRA